MCIDISMSIIEKKMFHYEVNEISVIIKARVKYGLEVRKLQKH